MGVTATWLDQDFYMKEAILAFRELISYHCGNNIADNFFFVPKEFAMVKKVYNIIIYGLLFKYISILYYSLFLKYFHNR